MDRQQLFDFYEKLSCGQNLPFEDVVALQQLTAGMSSRQMFCLGVWESASLFKYAGYAQVYTKVFERKAKPSEARGMDIRNFGDSEYWHTLTDITKEMVTIIACDTVTWCEAHIAIEFSNEPVLHIIF